MIPRIVAAVLALLAVAIALTSCGTIESGNVGVRTTLGKVNPEEVEPGIYLGLPGISRVQEFSSKEIGIDLNDLTPKARDNLSLRDLDVTVYYRVQPSSIADLYVKYAAQHGLEEGKRSVYLPAIGLLQRLARNAVFEQAAQIDSLVMHTRRDELSASVLRSLQAELDTNDKGVITVTRVVIRALTTDPAIERGDSGLGGGAEAARDHQAAHRDRRGRGAGRDQEGRRHCQGQPDHQPEPHARVPAARVEPGAAEVRRKGRHQHGGDPGQHANRAADPDRRQVSGAEIDR